MATVDLTFKEIFEEAFERATNGEMRSGYDLRTVRRSFNVMMMEWANRGLNLWTIEEGSLALSDGTATYSLPTDTIDLIEHTIQLSSGNEYNLYRMTVSTYAKQTNKSQEARPTQIYVQRTTSPQVTLWPTPDQSYTLKYWRIARLDGLSQGIAGTPDIPSRFVPPLISGLAYHIACKTKEGESRIQFLEQQYEKDWRLAAEEDRDRATLKLVPGGSLGG